MNLDLLTELCETPGAPGREERIRAVVRRELEPLADSVEVDPLGNLIARRAGGGGPRLMLSAHMDEIGFMVTHVEDGGFLRLIPLGGFDPKTLTAQRVIVHGREDLLGVLGTKAVHLMSDEEKRKAPDARRLLRGSRPAGRAGPRAGAARGRRDARARRWRASGDLVTCKSLDNRAGLYVMIEAFRALGDHDCEVVAVASVQEEVGLRGARVATASGAAPDRPGHRHHAGQRRPRREAARAHHHHRWRRRDQGLRHERHRSEGGRRPPGGDRATSAVSRASSR